MRIIVTPEAHADIADILASIAVDNELAAAWVATAIKSAIARLHYFPRMGALTQVLGVYMKIARPYRYLIFYELDDDAVVILHVRHPARRHPPSSRS
jgi:plasmid stabilization system protein ParE